MVVTSRILASPKTCIFMTVTDSILVGINLGIFTRLQLMSKFRPFHFCLNNGGTVSSQRSFRSNISWCSNFPSKWAGELKLIGLYTDESSLSMFLFVAFFSLINGMTADIL